MNNVFGAKGIVNLNLQIVNAIDISDSMRNGYVDGTMQFHIEKILSVSNNIDNNQFIENWLFHNRSFKTNPITPGNISNFITDNVMKRIGGGTSFAPILREIYSTYFTRSIKSEILFFKTTEHYLPEKPICLICTTDGGNDDRQDTEKMLTLFENKPIYIQFIVLGSTHKDFFKKISVKFNNINYVNVEDLKRITEDEIFELIISDSLIKFIKKNYPQHLTIAE